MRKMLVIARREYLAAVKTKSFFISLLVLPLMMGGAVIMQRLLRGQIDTKPKQFAIVDRTQGETLFQALSQAAQARNEKQIFSPKTGAQVAPAFVLERVTPSAGDEKAMNEQRYELSEKVRKGVLQGFMEIAPDAYEPGPPLPLLPEDPFEDTPESASAKIRYQTNNAAQNAFTRWADPILREAILQHRLSRYSAELTGDKMKSMLATQRVQLKGLTTRDAATGEIKDAKNESIAASVLIPAMLVAFMFMLIMVGATPLMQGILEEKMQRIAEVLLGSVTPFELMMGKLLGMTAVSLTLAAIYLGAGYYSANQYGYTEMVPPRLLAWFLLYQTLSVLMFGSLFSAVGAACTDMRETQSMLWPVMLLCVTPMFVWVNVLREPNSTFSTMVSFFPFATPMLMLLRQSVPPGVPAWQPVVGVALVLLTTCACVFVGGRIFRVGILMQGKGAQLKDLFRWVLRG